MGVVQTAVAVPPGQVAARRAVRMFSSVASYVLGTCISIGTGFSPIPSAGLVALLRIPWVAVIAGVAVVVLLTALSIYMTRQLGRAALFSRRSVARVVQFVAHTVLATIGGALLGVVIGLRGLPSSNGMLTLLTTHPPAGIALVGGLLLLIIVSPLFSFEPDPNDPQSVARQHHLLTATSISVVSTLLFLSLLAVVLVQPSWCPTSICAVAFDPHGVHDANMEAVFSTIQSSTFALPGDPTSYTVDSAPRQVPAARFDTKFPAYRVVVKVDNRQRNGVYPIIVQQVTLVIDSTSAPPDPLNVWSPGSILDYHAEPYLAAYGNQQPGNGVPASYVPVPGAHVQLQPGGSDELDIQVMSRQPADIHFHLEITYRLANEAALHTLVLPNAFEVIFSNAANWHGYQIGTEGHLSPSP